LYVSVGEALEAFRAVSVTGLRRWEAMGKLPAAQTAGGHRRYDLAEAQVRKTLRVAHKSRTPLPKVPGCHPLFAAPRR
jgi:DNA-binding transcriptional MerR regulator